MSDDKLSKPFNDNSPKDNSPKDNAPKDNTPDDHAPKAYDFDEAIFNQDVAHLKEMLKELDLPKEERGEFVTTLLRKACAFDQRTSINIELIDTLLDAGAKVNQPRGHETSAFGIICQSDDLELLRHLIRRGADVNADTNKDSFGASKPLHLACAQPGQDPAIVAELLKYNADPNAKGFFEQTPLHLAVAAPAKDDSADGKIPMVEMLLQKGAKINATDKLGHTPLFSLIAHSPDPKVAEKLIDSGANLRHVARNDGTALHLAAEKGLYQVVDLLIRKGAPLFQKDHAGKTPHQHLKLHLEEQKKSANENRPAVPQQSAAPSIIDHAKTEAALQAAEDHIPKRDLRNFMKHKWSLWKGPRS